MIDIKHEFEDYLSYCAANGLEPVTEEEIKDNQNPEDEDQDNDLIDGLINNRVQAKEFKIERRNRI